MRAAGGVAYARSGDVHILRYRGRVTYVQAPAIKRFADEVAGRSAAGGWLFDLSSAECLDSTNLGLVARIAERARTAGARVVILSTNEDITAVLGSMGFDQTYEVVTEAPPPAAATAESEIEGDVASSGELRDTMLDAHRMLMELSEAGRLQFQDVVAQLEAI